MAYVLCLIYVAVSYIRPAELNPAFIPYHVAEVTGILALAGALFSVLLRPRPVLNLPIDWCFLGFIAAAFVADPLGASAERLGLTAQVLLPLAAFYVLIRVTVETRLQMRVFIVVLCMLAVFQAVNAAVGYSALSGDGEIIEEQRPAGEYGDESQPDQAATRIVGTGMYGDPNDLVTSLLIVVPFLFSAVLSAGSGVVLRIAGLAALGSLGYAFQLAQSRGGFLALAALVGAYAYRRVGRVATVIVLAVVVVAGLAVGPSRIQNIDSQEASAQGRIEAWAAGLQMVKAHPILGVGYGEFSKYHVRVAHNSFVHVLAELGFVGGFLFIGVFYWHFASTSRTRNMAGAATSTLARDLFASGVGIVTAGAFLSLQYVPILFVPAVLGAARVAIERQPDMPEPASHGWDWALIGLLVVATIVVTWVAVRVLGSWA
jgi:O-antigen ligase